MGQLFQKFKAGHMAQINTEHDDLISLVFYVKGRKQAC